MIFAVTRRRIFINVHAAALSILLLPQRAMQLCERKFLLASEMIQMQHVAIALLTKTAGNASTVFV